MKTNDLWAQPGAIMAICAGFGLMFGMLWFSGQPIGILVGVMAGLIVGAIAERQRRRTP